MKQPHSSMLQAVTLQEQLSGRRLGTRQLHLGVASVWWLHAQGSVPAPAVSYVMPHAVISAAFDEQLMEACSME